MKKIQIIYIVLFLIATGCGLIFEKKITNSSVEIDSPSDSATITQYSQLFRWEPVDNATRYRLQVYSPDFSSAGTMVFDTITTATQVTLAFSPGNFSWRLRAENSGTETAYHYGVLYVKKGDFKTQYVAIVSPTADITITDNAADFSWTALYDAQKYTIELDTLKDFSTANKIVVNDPIVFKTVLLSKRADYWWRISGIDAAGENSLYSTPHKISYKMPQTILSAPASGATVTKSASFQWQALTDADYYKVNVYSSDSITVVNTSLAYTNSSSPLSNVDIGKTYYWSVIAVDKDNVKGAESTRRKLILNP